MLHGVIHTAGIAGGGVIQLKTPEIAASVLAPKVKGTLVLEHVLQGIQLDFLVLSSSISSILGEFGQVDYCAANTTFSMLLLTTIKPNVARLRWRLTGMPGERSGWQLTLRSHFTCSSGELRSLETGISSQEGVDAFSRILDNTLPQVVVSTQDLSTKMEQALTASSAVEELEPSLLPKSTYSRPELKTAYVAPRNDVEQKIAAIWQQILGIAQVGIHDNFFDLGGDSLLAVSLFAQIKKIFAKNLPLATLFQAPTVEQQAGLLHQSGSALWSSLVAIAPGGSKPPLFCVHAIGGNVLCYRDLPRYLGPEQPVYGLQAMGLDGKQAPHTRIEDMASHYIKEIRTIQPNGPYLLGGYSSGGTLVFEMAQQLHAQGQKVAMLAVFNTPSYKLKPNPALTLRQWFSLHWRNLSELKPKDKWAYIFLRTRLPKILNYYQAHLRSQSDLPQEEELYSNLLKAHHQAFEKYTPRVYPGCMTLFRSREQYPKFSYEPELGWGELVAGGVEVYEITGPHEVITSEPHIRVLSEKLKAHLDSLQFT